MSTREAEAKLKQLLDGHGLSNNKSGEGRSRQEVVLGSAVTRSLEQLPLAPRHLTASLDNSPGSRLPPRPASAVRRQLFTKDGLQEGKEARLRGRCLKPFFSSWHLVTLIFCQAQFLAQPDPGGARP